MTNVAAIVVILLTFVPILLAERLSRGAGLLPRQVEDIEPESDVEPEPESAVV